MTREGEKASGKESSPNSNHILSKQERISMLSSSWTVRIEVGDGTKEEEQEEEEEEEDKGDEEEKNDDDDDDSTCLSHQDLLVNIAHIPRKA